MGIMHLKIPDDLRDRFKARCALKRSNMQKEILEYIKKEVAKAPSRR
jgi:hypothetical protein